ncbi:hypothetical protein NU688_07355 [Variovorax sp. ZS18.2.2]|uniref:hypothetical protein n=1 Tax=Variovorax sp. ZS18.2.2 TaxID=2971255 RepID=UPI002150CD72|nr:hypothetical protein [Variovorax sp. ZS18.2.2]MCR6475967.1 hypothetical protein [Variovorax sp. ZS18.2.2]
MLAAIGPCATYADLAQATGFSIRTLMNVVGHLRRSGRVARVNEGEPSDEIALFCRTPAGDQKLEAAALGADSAGATQKALPGYAGTLTTVQRAIRVQPLLAMVWRI